MKNVVCFVLECIKLAYLVDGTGDLGECAYDTWEGVYDNIMVPLTLWRVSMKKMCVCDLEDGANDAGKSAYGVGEGQGTLCMVHVSSVRVQVISERVMWCQGGYLLLGECICDL